MTPESRELLKDAFAIIDGIPDELIAFGPPRRLKGISLDNGTVCSPEGWLAQHPAFIERGLALSSDGMAVLFKGEGYFKLSQAYPMAQVFGIPLDEANRLFGILSDRSQSEGRVLTDKEIWQQRMREYLGTRDDVEYKAAVEAEVASMDPKFSSDVPL